MGVDRGVLNLVEVAANLFGGVHTMVEVRDEVRDRTLEVDIVLPESIVGINEQRLVSGLPGRVAQSLVERGHRLIIRRFYRP